MTRTREKGTEMERGWSEDEVIARKMPGEEEKRRTYLPSRLMDVMGVCVYAQMRWGKMSMGDGGLLVDEEREEERRRGRRGRRGRGGKDKEKKKGRRRLKYLGSENLGSEVFVVFVPASGRPCLVC